MEKRDIKLLQIMGLKVKILRTENNVTQDELATLLSLDRVSLCNIESGKQSITPFNLLKLSKIFDVKVGYFFPTDQEHQVKIKSLSEIKKEILESKISKLQAQLKEL